MQIRSHRSGISRGKQWPSLWNVKFPRGCRGRHVDFGLWKSVMLELFWMFILAENQSAPPLDFWCHVSYLQPYQPAIYVARPHCWSNPFDSPFHFVKSINVLVETCLNPKILLVESHWNPQILLLESCFTSKILVESCFNPIFHMFHNFPNFFIGIGTLQAASPVTNPLRWARFVWPVVAWGTTPVASSKLMGQEVEFAKKLEMNSSG